MASIFRLLWPEEERTVPMKLSKENSAITAVKAEEKITGRGNKEGEGGANEAQ